MGLRPTDVSVTNLGTLVATDSIPIDRVGVNAAKKTTPADLKTYNDTTPSQSQVFDTTPDATPTAIGSRYWDVDYHTTTLITSANSSIQDGQEVVQWCVNKDSVPLPDGTVVKIIVSPGAPLAVSRASADTEGNSYLLGVTTQALSYPNGEGFVTLVGRVNGLNTDAYAEGTPIFLSVTPGQWTGTKPLAPYHGNFIGTVGRKHISQGYLLVNPVLGSELNELHDVDTTKSKTTPVDADALLLQDSADSSMWKKLTWSNVKATLRTYFNTVETLFNYKYKCGWLNRTPTMTVTATSGAFTFTIANNAASEFWSQGIYFTKNGDAITVSGLSADTTMFIYYNASGALVASVTPWTILNGYALTAIVFYQHADASAILYEERHGATRDLNYHTWAHSVIGSMISGSSSFALTAPSVGSPSTVNIAAGVYYDEDISLSITQQTSVRMWYRNTGGASMKFEPTPLTTAYKANGDATPKIAYDLNGTITYHSGAVAKWYVYYLYVNNGIICNVNGVDSSPPSRVYSVMGQGQYASLTAAQAVTDPALPNLPTQELKLTHILIFSQSNGTLSFIEAIDKRFTGTVAGGTVSPAISAGAVTFTPYDGIASTNVQAAIQEVADERMTNPMTAAGSLIVGNTGGVPAERTVGSDGDLLQVIGGVPGWATGRVLVATSTLASAGSGFTFTGLDINAHGGEYEVEVYCKTVATTLTYLIIRFNDDANNTGYLGQYSTAIGTNAFIGALTANGYIFNNGTTTNPFYITARLFLRGGYAGWQGVVANNGGAAGFQNQVKTGATVSNITQVQFLSDVANNLAIGTKISIYKRFGNGA